MPVRRWPASTGGAGGDGGDHRDAGDLNDTRAVRQRPSSATRPIPSGAGPGRSTSPARAPWHGPRMTTYRSPSTVSVSVTSTKAPVRVGGGAEQGCHRPGVGASQRGGGETVSEDDRRGRHRRCTVSATCADDGDGAVSGNLNGYLNVPGQRWCPAGRAEAVVLTAASATTRFGSANEREGATRGGGRAGA